MDYSKSGNARRDKGIPRNTSRETPGEKKARATAEDTKAALLARMKAAAAKSATKPTGA